ncbi:MAG TPA: hypothetical protein DCW29_11365 [Janthinobacterium sp.]|nr:hypothetical protein [Janthinobacterium sp.]
MRPPRQDGIVLLILLAVVGLGAATLLISALGNNNLQAARERRTLLALTRANDALLGFATVYGRLPRPALSALDGSENPAPCGDSDSACTGFLPWVTLGIEGADSWGKLLRYSVTPVFTRAPVQSLSAVAGKTVRTRLPGGAFSYLAGQDICTLSSPCAPFVVYSSGKNNFGTSVAGAAQANVARGNVDEAANNAASVHFISRVASAERALPGGEFDDLVAWVALPMLYKRMRAAHNLP